VAIKTNTMDQLSPGRSQALRAKRPRLALLLLAGLLLAGCQDRTQPPTLNSPTEQAIRGCPTQFDPSTDYFPDKVDLDYASGFTVDYHNHYKVVTVSDPWPGASQSFQYLLVQCGTPVPEGYDQAQVVTVPVERVVALSTTYLPHFDQLDRVDALVGVGQFDQVSTPSVRAKIDRGELSEFTSGAMVNVERLLVAQPDLVMAFSLGNDNDTYPRLIQSGVPVAFVAEYREASPLARAEWLKFTALFLNQEAAAQGQFDAIAQEYNALVELTQTVEQRPTVLTGSSYEGTWSMAQGESYAAQLLRDAGADYLWADTPGTGSTPLDIEAVYGRAAQADVWVNLSQDWQTQADAIAADPRYGQFQALAQNRAYNNNARLTSTGGNDFWESGPVNPHHILADLISIFHPDLLPDHDLIYYQPLLP
jgi:iron complex transport system substrate-binding protein